MAIVVFMSYGMNGKTEKEMKEARKRLKNKTKEFFMNQEHGDYYFEIFDRRHNKDGKPVERNYRISEWIEEYGLSCAVRFTDNSKCTAPNGSGRLFYLGEAIKKLDKIDAIVFDDDWMEHKGCVIERRVAEGYGIPIIE